MSYHVGYPTVGQQFQGQGPIAPAFPAAVPPPPAQSPAVYAQNYACPVPNIQTFASPPCNDPATSVQVTKRVFTTNPSGVFIVDSGVDMQAGFGASLGGPLDAPPVAGVYAVQTDSTTTGVVRDITIAWDPFADQTDGPAQWESLRSYGYAFSALLGGEIVVNNTPFPTVIPILSAIKTSGGIDSFWTQASLINQYFVSAVVESTHAHAPAPIEIFLPEASNFRVDINVPRRAVATSVYQAPDLSPFVYVWTGIVTILQEENTKLGSIATR